MPRYTPTELRAAIRGPVFPIVMPFAEDGALDERALRGYVEFLAGAGVPAVMTTVGTSRFNLMSHDEMRRANCAVVEAAAGRCITIVAGPMEGALPVHAAFAAHAAEIGADAAIIFHPERHYGDAAILDFFRAVSGATRAGVMVHEMPMRNGLGGGTVQYGLDLLERITDLPGVSGFKEECMDPGYSYKILRRLADKTGIIGAGSMRCYMRDYHAGARAYLVGVGSFFPAVELAFFEAMSAHRIDHAHTLARRFEDPYFDTAVALGWHRALKETMHLLGLMPAFERAPMPRLDEAGRARLAALIDGLGWRSAGAPDLAA